MTPEEVIFDELHPPEALITFGLAHDVRYRLSTDYVATSGDWIGLFRCTDDACELVGFEWAPTVDPEDPSASGHRQRTLCFHADQIKRPLGATDNDLYHFAYVTRDGRIAGQSGHFRVHQGHNTVGTSSSLGRVDVCSAADQCLTACRMLPVNVGARAQALEKCPADVLEQRELKKVNEFRQYDSQSGCDDQFPEKVIDFQNRSPTSSDLKSSFRLATPHSSCRGCQIVLREVRSLKHLLEMEFNRGQTTPEEKEEGVDAQKQERVRQGQMTANKETAFRKEEELLDIIEDLKQALELSKERERCLQHHLNVERTLRMELIRAQDDLESSRTVNGSNSLNKQQDSLIQQVDDSCIPQRSPVTRETNSSTNDQLESPTSGNLTEKDVRGSKVLVCTDCLQRHQRQTHQTHQQQQKQQQQQQERPSTSIDRPWRHKKIEGTGSKSGKTTGKILVLDSDQGAHLKKGQYVPEVLLRQAVVDLDELVVPTTPQEVETSSNDVPVIAKALSVYDTSKQQNLPEVLREEAVAKVSDFNRVREFLGETTALDAAVETNLSEIKSKDVDPDVSQKIEAKRTEHSVSAAEKTNISQVIGTAIDLGSKLAFPEVVVSTVEGKLSTGNIVHPERRSGVPASFKTHCAINPKFQMTTVDKPTRTNNSKKPDRQQNHSGNTTVMVKSRDSLTTYSGSNLSLWLLFGNDKEPERIVARQTKVLGQKSPRSPHGPKLIIETQYRSGTDAQRIPIGTAEAAKKKIDKDECLASVSGGSDRVPWSNTTHDTLNGSSCHADVSAADAKTSQLVGSLWHSGSCDEGISNATHQMAATQDLIRLGTSPINNRQMSLEGGSLLPSTETLTDSGSLPNEAETCQAPNNGSLPNQAETCKAPNNGSLPNQAETPKAPSNGSSPNQAETYKAPNNTNILCRSMLTSSPENDVDDSYHRTLAVPWVAVESISPVVTVESTPLDITKEQPTTDFNRHSMELAMPAASEAQPFTKPDVSCFNRATEAEANQSIDACCSVNITNRSQCAESADTATPSGDVQLNSVTMRTSPSSETNEIVLISKISDVGAQNAVLQEPEKRKEDRKSQDPVFTSSSRFCFISDETTRFLSGIMENAMPLTGALQLLDAASHASPARPSEVKVTDTATSVLYAEEPSPSVSSTVENNSKPVKIIKPLTFGNAFSSANSRIKAMSEAVGAGRILDGAASEARACRGSNSRQPGMAIQNAKIISDGIREYHRRMKAKVEAVEENTVPLEVVKPHRFRDPLKDIAKPKTTGECYTVHPKREPHPRETSPEEMVSNVAAAAAVSNLDSSSPSSSVVAPKVKVSATPTTDSVAVVCCPKTFLRQHDSLDVRRCECQAHQNSFPDGKQLDGSSEEDRSQKDVAGGLQQLFHSLTSISGDLSNTLHRQETNAGAVGISPTGDKTTEKDLETTHQSMATTSDIPRID